MGKNKFYRVSFLSLDYLSHRFADLLAQPERKWIQIACLMMKDDN